MHELGINLDSAPGIDLHIALYVPMLIPTSSEGFYSPVGQKNSVWRRVLIFTRILVNFGAWRALVKLFRDGGAG